MWITKEMSKDFKEATWIPRITNLTGALEDVCDALSSIGYSIRIEKKIEKKEV